MKISRSSVIVRGPYGRNRMDNGNIKANLCVSTNCFSRNASEPLIYLIFNRRFE